MKVHNTGKRLAAGLLAITLAGGAVPANIGVFDLKLSNVVVASAASNNNISNATVTMKEHSFKVQSVELNGTKLQKNIDYTVSYSQKDSGGNTTEFSDPPKQSGKYDAVITGIGDYEGVIYKSFDIVGSGYEGISIIDGVQGSNTPSNEHMWLIFDGKTNTKWCSRVIGAGNYANRDSDWLLFEADTPFAIHNYVLTTANDTSYYKGRNWKSWRVYGSNNAAAADYTLSFTDHKATDIDENIWSLVHQVTNDTVLQPQNFTEFAYAVPHNRNEYKYYLLIIDDIVDTSDNIQQMSEIEFNADLPVSVTHVDAVPVGCLNVGNIEHWYDEYNDKYYRDEEAKYEIDEEEVIIPTIGHHIFGEPEWTWNAKNKTAAATFTCTNCGEKHTVEAEIKRSSIAATCTTPAYTCYTAVVEFEGVTYKSKPQTYKGADALGHSYGKPEWKYDDKNHTVTAIFKCDRCNDVQTVDATVTSKTTSPTYVKDGKIVYTASVKFNGQTYTTNKTVIVDKLTYTPPTITYQKGDGAVKLQWTDVKDAEEYGVAGFINNKWRMIDQGEGTSYVLKNLNPGKEYKVCVATKLNGEWFTDSSNAIVVTPKAAVTSPYPKFQTQTKDGKIGFKWESTPNAEKYAIAVYRAGKWVPVKQFDSSVHTWTTPQVKNGTYTVVVIAKINGEWVTAHAPSNAVTIKVS
ncbi:MAG: hypothetical protein K6F71_11745 [Ruminococcus sp.]|uniref:hypothetical protein n=1 Tax=Ruminococcus sp. TaxID=41978 RepID=UPI0025EC2A46|nr:hypothetical protein [Ruminococcus sp.]MCR5541470.1 hypothetical protein [Ruminococcus sp.]